MDGFEPSKEDKKKPAGSEFWLNVIMAPSVGNGAYRAFRFGLTAIQSRLHLHLIGKGDIVAFSLIAAIVLTVACFFE